MSSIQSNVGLITGIPIKDTVDQLMAVAARPRNLLQQRVQGLQNEQLAIDQLGSLLLGLRLSATRLGTTTNFSATTAKSKDTSLLTATATGAAKPGKYSFTPLQTAAAHQVVSSSIADVSSLLAEGTFQLGFGGQVDRGIALSELNGGSGFVPGKIRISDRSGASAEIDLRSAQTIDDVLSAINGSSGIDVIASVSGDAIRLTDTSGGSGSLRVREVGPGSTAASLGLGGIYVSADEATGSDIFSLHSGTRLSTLNDGNGVRLRDEVADLDITMADGTTFAIDIGTATTLGDVVAAINLADQSKLTASISADGNRLELTDLTVGTETFKVTSVGTGTAAEQLGLTKTAVGGVITGGRLVSGLADTLVSSLNGGQGLAELGAIAITDRAGNPPVVVDLSSAETLGEIVSLINSSGANVTAAINSSRNGISLVDTSGGTGNLTIANSDATNTADALGLAIDAPQGMVNSGTLNRQTVSETTQLSSLNGGRGVRAGNFSITNSLGIKKNVVVRGDVKTIGEVIDLINELNIDVEASLNATGDGILLTDMAGGSKTLTVSAVNNSHTAADLHLVGQSTTTNEAGQQVLDGSTRFSIDLSTLNLQQGVALSSLAGGKGISLGTFKLVDSSGAVGVVSLGEPGNEASTIEDVIERINATGIGVKAQLNIAGTGIELVDTAGGSGTLTVSDLGSGKSAEQLKIGGTAQVVGGEQKINGAGLFTPANDNANALDALAKRINDLKGGFTASTFFDGNGYRLAISADSTGGANQLLIDGGVANLGFAETTRARDAVLQLGGSETGGVVVSSATNEFKEIMPGLTTTVVAASAAPVEVTVTADDAPFVSAAEGFVEAYNSLRKTMGDLTSFDAESLTTGLLFGRGEVVRIETDLGRLLSGSFAGSSEIRSLEALGISLNDKGQLELNKTKLRNAFESNPAEVERMLSAEKVGLVSRFTGAIDRLAGEENSLLAARSDALTNNIESAASRIAAMDLKLERERERTLMEFYRLEEVIAKMQNNMSSLEGMQAIPPLAFQRQ